MAYGTVGQYRGRQGMRVGGNVARMAYQAGKHLYKNRESLKKAAKKLFVRKNRPLQGPARKLGYQAKKRTTSIVNVGDPASTGNELTVYRGSTGRYPSLKPNRMLKLVQAGMNTVTYRAQGLTNFDTSVGFYALANRQSLDAVPLVNTPIHIWDLTILPNVSSEVIAGRGYYWSSDSSAANIDTYSLPTQLPSGASSGSYYHAESASGLAETSNNINANKAMHQWSNIKLLLYGPRKRGTTFYIDFIRVKDELAHPIAGASSNKSKKEFFRTQQSSLIFSPLQQHNGRNNKAIQYVKRYKFYIPGGSADDLDTIGKVKEVSIFLKQANVYNLQWESADNQDALPHTQEDGADYTLKAGPQDHPYTGSRLMMMIRAFSPERRALATNVLGVAAADPLTEPSYDMVLRNKWMLPS